MAGQVGRIGAHGVRGIQRGELCGQAEAGSECYLEGNLWFLRGRQSSLKVQKETVFGKEASPSNPLLHGLVVGR